MTDRREELAAGATDHVLEHGLLGLSLRPLAAALGTSDRMLIYHFGSKDDLVAAVLRTSNDRAVAALRRLLPSDGVAAAVHDLWQEMTSPVQARCLRVYIEAAALGVLGLEPYAGIVGEANKVWLQALADHLESSGLSAARAARGAVLLDATFTGLQLDQGPDSATARQAVADLADALAAPQGAHPSLS